MFLPAVELLGHVVSAEGVKVVESKVAAIKDWPTPTCIRDVQAFLGLANFYRCFVRNFASIAHPLTELKGVEFTWGGVEAAAFEQLKTALMSAPVLQIFDETKPREVWVDALDYAVGATLV